MDSRKCNESPIEPIARRERAALLYHCAQEDGRWWLHIEPDLPGRFVVIEGES